MHPNGTVLAVLGLNSQNQTSGKCPQTSNLTNQNKLVKIIILDETQSMS